MPPAGQRAGYVFLGRCVPCACSLRLRRDDSIHINLRRGRVIDYALRTSNSRRGWVCLRSPTRAFTDPDAYFAGIRNLQIDGVITTRGEFRAEAIRIDSHLICWNASPRPEPASDHEDNAEREAVADPLRDRLLINSEMQVSGIETSKDQIAMIGLDWPYYLRSSAACGWGTMSLTPEDLAAASEAIIGRPLMPPSFPRCTSPAAPVASRLWRLHEAAAHLAKTAPTFSRRQRWRERSRRRCSKLMIFCPTEGDWGDVRNVHRHRARVMRRLEEVVKADPDKPLYMPQICATVGASIQCCETVARIILA